MRIVTPAQMKALDTRTITELGLPAELLMENAGRGVVDAIVERIGSHGDGRTATVLCGVGNNGGDGFVIARQLHYLGFRVHACTVGDRGKLSEEAKLHYKVMQSVGVRDRHFTKPPDKRELGTLRRSLMRSAVIVDALLGIGVTSELREPYRTFVAQVDGRHEGLVVAVDMPSGVHAETGEILGAATHCDLTCAMGALKIGVLCGDAPAHCGQLHVVDIGVPPAWVGELEGVGEVLDHRHEASLMPARDPLAHKGRFGHLFVAAGSPGRSGAALLASMGALRSGVGLCTLATSGEIRSRLEGAVPDLMVEAVRGGSGEKKKIEKLLQGKSAIAAGPGMGTAVAQIDLLKQLIELSSCPVVLDADALTCVAARPELVENAADRLVLTPHPGEMARLLQREVSDVQADRVAAAREAAKRFKAIVVLKGARTVIASPTGRFILCNEPNAALAKAGSGDVLCGIIGALLAQGLSCGSAARLGVSVHNRAGHGVASEIGAVSAMASDLVSALAKAWQS